MRKKGFLRKLLSPRTRLVRRSRVLLRSGARFFRKAKIAFAALDFHSDAFRKISTAALALVMVASSVFYAFAPKPALGQTYTLIQNDWSGGASADTANAPSNLAGWTKYGSASSLAAGAESVALTPSQGSAADTFTASANNDTAKTTANWNTSTGQLEMPDQNAFTANDLYSAANGYLSGSIATVYNPADGYIYGVGQGSAFVKYDPNTKAITDLRVSSGLKQLVAPDSVVALCLDQAHGKIYMLNLGNGFEVYDIASNAVTDLGTTSGLSAFWTTGTYGNSMAFDASTSKLYLGNSAGKFAVYDAQTNVATNLTVSSGFSVFWSSLIIYSIAIDPSTHKVYLTGGSGSDTSALAVYDPGTGLATNLAVTSGFSGFFTQTAYAMAWNSFNTKLYIVGGGTSSSVSKFAVYDPGTGLATDLFSSTGFSAFCGYGEMRTALADPSTGKVYIGGSSGTFAVYTPDGATVDLRTSSGLSSFLSSNTQNAVSSFSANWSAGEFYFNTTNTFASFNVGSGSATNHTTYVNPTFWNASNAYAVLADPINGLVYLFGSGFGAYDKTSGTFTNLSVSSGWGTGGIYCAVGNSDWSKLYLFGSNAFASYDISSNTVTNLYASSGMSSMGSFIKGSAVYDATRAKIYFVGNLGRFGVYDIASNTVTNLTTSSGLSAFWSMDDIYAAAYDASSNLVYLGGANGMFAVYNPGTNTATDLHVASGLSAFWGTDYMYKMVLDAANHKLYLGGYNNFALYTPGSPGTAVFKYSLNGLSAMSLDAANGAVYLFGIGRKFSVYKIGSGQTTAKNSLIPNEYWNANTPKDSALASDGKIYLAGIYGEFMQISPPCSNCAANSLALDATTQNISSATLTKHDTPGTGTLTYQLSNDGGATYNTVTPDSLYPFSSTGSDLRFKILMTGNATVQDVTVAYNYYPASGTLVSSKFDSGDAGNVLNRLVWLEDQSLPAGTTATVSLRTAANSAGLTGSWTDFTASSCSKSTQTVTCDAAAIPSSFQDGANDRWFQYQIALTSDGRGTPTISSLSMQIVVNAAPEVRNVTAMQNADGTVTIGYEVRDSDTATGSPTNRGHVTPSFEYWNGSSYQPISALAAGDANQKTVANDGSWNGVTYSATWNAASEYPGHFMNGTAKIKVTANDGEGANPTGSAESGTFTLDTANPSANSLTVDASRVPAVAHLASSDDSAVTVKVSATDPTLTSTSAEAFAETKTLSVAEGGTVYARFYDAYSNASAIISTTVPAKPTAMMIQDASNMIANPAVYRLFVAWKASVGSFASYKVYRSTSLADQDSWPLLATIGSASTNYCLDSGVQAATPYYYYVTVVDPSGNISYKSSVVTGTADGTQDGNEGGGGIGPPPTITNVSSGTPLSTSADITWDTDSLSDSVVKYSTTPGSFTHTASVGALVNNDAGVGKHAVTLSGLTPGATYYYKVESTDIDDQATTDANGGNGYSFTLPSGPVIANTLVSRVTNYAAEISWDTDVNATTQAVYSVNPDMSDPVITSGTSDPSTHHGVTIGNLSRNTRYYFYVKSVDSGNNATVDRNIVNGQVLYYTFLTTNDQTPPVISAVSTTSRTASADVVWTTDELADSQVEYGPTGAYGSATTLDSTATVRHITTIAGLTLGATYNYRVKSRDVNGNLAIGTNGTFTTRVSDDATPPAISAVAVPSVTLTGATITWTTDEAATSFVEYGTSASLGASTGNVTDRVTSHSVTLSQLSPHEQHYFKVHSEDAAGNAATDDNGTQLYSFTTAADVTAPTISNVATALISDTSAVITWQTNEPATSVVKYGADASYGTEVSSASGPDVTHSVTLTGLSKKTAYVYEVISADPSSNSAADDNHGQGYPFTTTDQPGIVARANAPEQDVTPPMILNLRIGSIGKNSATAEWNTDEPADTVVKYGPTIAYGSLAGSVDDKVSSHRADLTDLKPGTIYHLIAVSSDASGNQGTTSDRQFATLNEDGTQIPLPPAPQEGVPANASAKNPPAAPEVPEKKEDPIIATINSLESIVRKMLANPSEQDASDTFASTMNEIAEKMVSPPSIVGIAPRVDVEGTTAKVSWTTDKKASSAIAYAAELDYKPGQAEPYGALTSNPGEFSTIHEVTLQNLLPAAKYHFQVRSKGSMGSEAKSDDATFQTTSDLPVISNLGILEVKDSAATLAWTTNVPTDAEIRYRNYATGAELTQGDTAMLRDHKFKLENLAAGASYEVTVSAKDEFGNEVSGRLRTITTSKDANPPAISKVSSDSTLYPGKESRVQTIITWATDEPSTSRVSYQEGIAKDAEIFSTTVDQTLSANHTVVITKFRPGTVYKFRVESADASGNSAKSSEFIILTPQQKASVLDVIIGNFESVFGWTKKL